jgi:hypothetical protein
MLDVRSALMLRGPALQDILEKCVRERGNQEAAAPINLVTQNASHDCIPNKNWVLAILLRMEVLAKLPMAEASKTRASASLR